MATRSEYDYHILVLAIGALLAMPTDPKLQRVKFAHIGIGQTFYDPISAEYFVKRSDTHAAMISWTADGSILDEFEEDDLVGIGQQ